MATTIDRVPSAPMALRPRGVRVPAASWKKIVAPVSGQNPVPDTVTRVPPWPLSGSTVIKAVVPHVEVTPRVDAPAGAATIPTPTTSEAPSAARIPRRPIRPAIPAPPFRCPRGAAAVESVAQLVAVRRGGGQFPGRPTAAAIARPPGPGDRRRGAG